MKSLGAINVLVSACTLSLTGCGVDKRVHQNVVNTLSRTINEIAEANNALEADKKKLKSLNVDLEEKNIALKNLTENVNKSKGILAERQASEEQLMYLEQSAFDDAARVYSNRYNEAAL